MKAYIAVDKDTGVILPDLYLTGEVFVDRFKMVEVNASCIVDKEREGFRELRQHYYKLYHNEKVLLESNKAMREALEDVVDACIKVDTHGYSIQSIAQEALEKVK